MTDAPPDTDRTVVAIEDPDASPVGERLSYVGALDGIRAASVLAVMAFHAGVQHVTGGFLGVDAFFVLSGFLITSLLLGEAHRTATIRLGAFWARRARRLLPALLLVLCFVGLLAWLGAAQGTYPGLRLDSLATLLYVANWHFILQGSSYFQAALAPSPLTHTWSLAIEEQFYLLWPLVVLALVRLRRGPGTLLVLAAGGAVASSAWMAWLHRGGGDPTRMYYGTDSHAMTMLCGAALAAGFAMWSRGRDPSSLRVRGSARVVVQVLGWLGVLCMSAMVFKATGTSAWLYKGGFLVAGVATAGVIASSVLVPSGALGVVLGLAPVRFVGRISYGLYLWHFPLFLWLDHQRTGVSGTALLFVRFSVTFAVATASFFLVERPIRHGLVLRGVKAALATACAVGATIALVVSTSLAAALPAGAALPPQPPFRDPVRALMLGDSTMLTLAVAVAPWGRVYDVDENASSTILGCGVTTSDAQVEHGVAIPTNWPCRRQPGTHQTMHQIWSHAVRTFDPQVVGILAGRWEVHNLLVNGRRVTISQPAFQRQVAEGLTDAVHVATAQGAHAVLMTQPCASSGERPDGRGWPEDSPRRIAIYNRIVREVARATHSSVLDLFSMVCPSGRYQRVIDGVIVRAPDGVHFSVLGGPYLSPRVLPVLVAEGRAAERERAAPTG